MQQWGILAHIRGAARRFWQAVTHDLDQTKKAVDIIQGFTLSIAIIVGGIWTWYIFKAQLYVQNSKAQLEKLHHDLEREAKLEIAVDAKQLPTVHGKRVIVGTVTINNIGTIDSGVELTAAPIKIYSVDYDALGRQHWNIVHTLPLDMGSELEHGVYNLLHFLNSDKVTPAQKQDAVHAIINTLKINLAPDYLAQIKKPDFPIESLRDLIVKYINRNYGEVSADNMEWRIFMIDLLDEDSGLPGDSPLRSKDMPALDNVHVGHILCYAGMHKIATFSTTVDKPGIYAVGFSAKRNEKEIGITTQMGVDPGSVAFNTWSNEAYIVVK